MHTESSRSFRLPTLWFIAIGIAVSLSLSLGCRDSSSDSLEASSTETSTESSEMRDSPSSPIQLARLALERGDLVAAQQSIRQALVQDPKDAVAMELAGDISGQSGEWQQAIQWYESAVAALTSDETVKSNAKPSLMLLDKLGRSWMAMSLPFEATEALKNAVSFYPDTPSLRKDLGGLLASLGMERESAIHLRWLAQRGYAGPSELIILSDLTRPQTDDAMCSDVISKHPGDVRPLFSLARNEAHFAKWNEVGDKLEKVINVYPENKTASAYYGRAMVELGRDDAVEHWASHLPAGIEDEPQYWVAAGVASEKKGGIEAAARGYWQAILIDEFDAEALNRLANCLAELDIENDFRVRLNQRISQITSLRKAVDALNVQQGNSQANAIEIASLLESMGRYWEAAAWLRVGALMTSQTDPALSAIYQSLRSKMTGKTPWQLPEALLARDLDLSEFPVVDWQGRTPVSRLADTNASETIIHFEDQAKSRNLVHRCRIAKQPGEELGLWIYQSVACGTGIIDFDLDGWPDVYLTTMEGTPHQTDSGPNRLFRNAEGVFIDVTEACEVGDKGFAQGVSVGDYNADGFADLFAANIGQNRLFRNNGDGTFTDVTEQVSLVADDWTTSVAMVDIDQDGHLDIFEVGYCAGQEPFETSCTREGLARSCSPLSFSSQRDRVWRGTGDGSFTDVTSDWLGEHDRSSGLAIVAGIFDEQPGLDVYVANDMSANHFWSSTKSSDGTFHLQEQAAMRGIAVDARATAQASMGIAVADPDADGDFDFFLTNHANESNTFYEQVSPGLWVDHSDRVGLSVPSFAMLGFGTVWFDADNDGELELMVANGHVDDFSHLGEAYRMALQLFHRSSQGSWSMVSADQLGECFAEKRLAKNLVNVDVDRDGRVDAIVSGLFDPVSVLINTSETAFNDVTLFLKGTNGHRDAIGCVVTLEVEGRQVASQLIGGDGFQCSNERCLRFGVGAAEAAENIVVQWPSGQRESFGPVSAGHEYVLVQGQGTPFQLAISSTRGK